MATFTDQLIKLKTYALMAYGDKPYEPGDGKKLLVIDKEAGREKYRPAEVNANGFDMGTLRQDCFDTREAAQMHLDDIQSGRFSLNMFRNIDPDRIMLKELVFEVRAIDFNDYEHEIMGLLGALDHMKADEKALFKKAFPGLVDTKITPPPYPPYDTHNGNPSAVSTYTYVLAGASLRERFYHYAEPQTQSPAVSASAVANELRPSRFLYQTLTGVAEEIGKARIGLLDADYAHILFMRLYDYNTTYEPERKTRSNEPSDIEMAMIVLSRQDPVVIETILQAMKLRNIRPFPEGFGEKGGSGLQTLTLDCK